MTIDEMKTSDKLMLTPADVGKALGTDPYNITLQAKQDRADGCNSFPFPVMIIGTRVKIPRLPFLRALGVIE